MKYVSLDIETTCLSPREHRNILGISMVVEDTSKIIPVRELPHFTCVIDQGTFEGSAEALAMNSWILEMITAGRRRQYTKYPVFNTNTSSSVPAVRPEQDYAQVGSWVQRAQSFLNKHFEVGKRITVAGKNVAGFDIQFLPPDLQRRFKHRVIDVGSVFVDWTDEQGEVIPSLDSLKAAYTMGAVSHDMYDDACDVIEILRKSYNRT